MDPGARSKFGAPIFEPEVFWKQMYCIKECTCDIGGTFHHLPQSFGAPRSDSAPGECAPFAPLRYAPDGRQFKGLAMAAALLNCFVGYNFEYCHIVAENKFADALRQNGNVRWFSVEN